MILQTKDKRDGSFIVTCHEQVSYFSRSAMHQRSILIINT